MNKLIKYIPYLLVALALYLGFISYQEEEERITGLTNQIPALKNQIRRKKKSLKDLEQYYKDIEIAKKRMAKVQEKVQGLQTRLPDKIDDTSNLQVFSDMAKGLKLKNLFLTPAAEVNKGLYFSKKYEVKAEGTYLQFLIFFEKISEMKLLFNIDTIKFRPLSSGKRGRFQLLDGQFFIEAYRYNLEDSGIK